MIHFYYFILRYNYRLEIFLTYLTFCRLLCFYFRKEKIILYCAYSTMEAQLRTFLDKHRVKQGELFTHTTKSTGALENGWHSGSYYISKKDIEPFMILYCNAVKNGCTLTITEKPGSYFPLRLDFDMKSNPEDGLKRQYTQDTLRKIVELCQRELKKIIHPNAFSPTMLWCIVLEKKCPRKEEGFIKDGFHLHFPFLYAMSGCRISISEMLSQKK
jgi:hypothetical protein